jgi:hypothetical protein
MHTTHSTLASLVDRALAGNRRPLEFYLREQSRLPGTRANLELVNDFSFLVAALIPEHSDEVHSLLDYLVSNENKKVAGNTPAEFVVLCGLVAYGACAAVRAAWRSEVFELLERQACSVCWRIREGVATAFQRLLEAAPRDSMNFLILLATQGNYLQQRAAIASFAEPSLLHSSDIAYMALDIQQIVLERLHASPAIDRKREDFRVLRQALGYTLSVVTAATPVKGFALMRECAGWRDTDINWILRENLKKKRLAKFVNYTEELTRLIA